MFNVTRTAYITLKNAYDPEEGLTPLEEDMLYSVHWRDIDSMIVDLDDKVQEKIDNLVQRKTGLERQMDNWIMWKSWILGIGVSSQIFAVVIPRFFLNEGTEN